MPEHAGFRLDDYKAAAGHGCGLNQTVDRVLSVNGQCCEAGVTSDGGAGCSSSRRGGVFALSLAD